MRISVIALVVMGLLAGVAAAQPVDKAAAQAAFADGQRRYAAGEYLPAAVKFEAAYAADPDPVYLFNVAQAYRLGNACGKAAGYYRRFLEKVPNPPNLENVKQYIEQSDACAKGSGTIDPGTPITGPTEPVVVIPPIDKPPVTPDPGRTKRWVGIGLMFVGGAALGAGVYFNTEIGRIEDDRARQKLELGCSVDKPCAAGWSATYDDDGHSAELKEIVAFSVGGAAVIGGVALYLMGRNPEGSSVAIVPTTGGAVAVSSFRF